MLANPEFRPDVQGLRALAMGAVALFHASVPGFAGGYVGVDIFFVISGFLITGLLVREVERSGRIDFPAFYARRIRRLLPAALLVLAATAVTAYVLLSPLEQRELIRPLLASALYASNFWFATQATDYLGGDLHANPVLHTWSLAVEEQFYLIWPLLILVAAWAGSAGGLRWRLAFTMATVLVVSLVLCLWLTGTSQPWAFFASPARAWEFAAGGLVYLGRGWFGRLGGGPRSMLFVLGLAMMLAAILGFDAGTSFPGVAALLPVAGAVLVIGAGERAAGWTSFLLGNPLAQWLGNLSYSWYLWHWPVLVFPAVVKGPLGLSERLLWVVVSLALAAITYYTVENRVRFSAILARTPGRGLAMGATLTAVALVGVLALRGAASDALASPPQADYISARAELPAIYRDGCHLSYEDVAFPSCAYGDPAAGRTMVLFGDSHAAHWFPALERIALDSGWRLVSLTKSACPAVDVNLQNTAFGRPYAECEAWRAAVLDRISAIHPALVIMASSEVYVHDSRQAVDVGQWQRGIGSVLRRLRTSGAAVVVLHDTPRPGFDVPACLSRAAWRGDRSPCSFARRPSDTEISRAERAAAAGDDGVRVVDVSDVMCGHGRCDSIVGGHVAYRDENHLSVAMSRALAPVLESHIGSLLARLSPGHVERAARLHPAKPAAGIFLRTQGG